MRQDPLGWSSVSPQEILSQLLSCAFESILDLWCLFYRATPVCREEALDEEVSQGGGREWHPEPRNMGSSLHPDTYYLCHLIAGTF
jgi:hypothetical protein